MGSMDLLVKDAIIVTQNRERSIGRGDIAISDGKIEKVGSRLKGPSHRTIECGGRMLAVPGFINTHCHIPMSPLKGMLDCVGLEEFLSATSDFDRRNSKESVYYSSILGIMEMIRGGITDFVDFYYDEDAVKAAVEALSYKAHLAWVTLDRDKTTQRGDPISNAERFVKSVAGNKSVEPMIAVQGVYAAGKETYSTALDIAKENGVMTTTHISETQQEVKECKKRYRTTPVGFLDRIGFLNKRLLAAHCVWISRREAALLSKCAGVSYNPTSNMKLSSGVSPIMDLVEQGANVTLGTDSVASNDSLSMLNEMKYGNLVQRICRGSYALTAQQTLDFATLNASIALGSGAGSIEAGRPADIAILSPESFQGVKGREINWIVYSAGRDNVVATIVNGNVLYYNGFNEKAKALGKKAERYLEAKKGNKSSGSLSKEQRESK